MQKKSNQKAGAIISAGLIIAIALFFAGIIFLLIMVVNSFIAAGFLLLYIGVLLAVAIGIAISLRQRLKELKDGEAEEAKKY